MARRAVNAGALVLDSEGLVKLSRGDSRVRSVMRTASERRALTVVSAVTLAEALRGGPRDAPVHQVLSRITVLPVTPQLGRRAGEILGATGLSGHRCAIDAMVAATALELTPPVLLLTSDPDDLTRLVEEPGRPKDQRVAVIHV